MKFRTDDTPDSPFISTGQLPPNERVQALIEAAYAQFVDDRDGTVSDVYPALAAVEPEQFGLCMTDAAGRMYDVGDADVPFTIMSVSKPFVFALICEQLGPQAAREQLGVNGTGRSFNSLDAITTSADGRTNPMVNPGAIAATSLAPGASIDERWQFIVRGLERFAGRELTVDESVYESASASNVHNRAIVAALHERGRLGCDPAEALDLYTRQCALQVTARDLALMGATFADGGVQPVTRERVVAASVARHVLAVMTTAGMYETSGDWLYDVGLPGKSGISGGVVTVAPGKGALGTFAPRLDAAGNSVRGQHATALLARTLGLDLFASQPVVS